MPGLPDDPEDRAAVFAHAKAIAKAIVGADAERLAGMRELLGALDNVFDEMVDGHATHYLDLIAPTILFRSRRVPEHLRARKIQAFLAGAGVTESVVERAGFPRAQLSTRSIGKWLRKRLADPRYQLYLLEPGERAKAQGRSGRPSLRLVDPPSVPSLEQHHLDGLSQDAINEVLAQPKERQVAHAIRLRKRILATEARAPAPAAPVHAQPIAQPAVPAAREQNIRSTKKEGALATPSLSSDLDLSGLTPAEQSLVLNYSVPAEKLAEIRESKAREEALQARIEHQRAAEAKGRTAIASMSLDELVALPWAEFTVDHRMRFMNLAAEAGVLSPPMASMLRPMSPHDDYYISTLASVHASLQ